MWASKFSLISLGCIETCQILMSVSSAHCPHYTAWALYNAISFYLTMNVGLSLYFFQICTKIWYGHLVTDNIEEFLTSRLTFLFARLAMDLSVVVIIVLQVLFVPSLLQTEDSYSSFILFAVLMISINVISIFKSLIDKDRSTLPVATPPSADSVGTCLLCASTVILVATLLTVKHFATKVETTNLAILFLVAGTGLLRIMKPNSYHGDYVLAVCYLLSILHTWKIAYFFFVDPVCKYESTTK